MTTAAAVAPARTLVIACGALAREVRAVVALNGWTHVDLDCVPAILHNAPSRIPDAVAAKIDAARERYDSILCLYGDCGTGGRLDRVLEARGVARIPGAHCYAFHAGLEDFAAMHAAEPGTFYLTDYLVRHFETLVVRGLGIDRHPELLETYFGNYRRVVYLAQTSDGDLDACAAAAAVRLGLDFEIRRTGLDGIARFIAGRGSEEGAPWRN
jgi:hypothetical protein